MQKVEITIPDAVPLVVLPTKEVHVGQQEATVGSSSPAVQIQVTAAEGKACCSPGCC